MANSSRGRSLPHIALSAKLFFFFFERFSAKPGETGDDVFRSCRVPIDVCRMQKGGGGSSGTVGARLLRPTARAFALG